VPPQSRGHSFERPRRGLSLRQHELARGSRRLAQRVRGQQARGGSSAGSIAPPGSPRTGRDEAGQPSDRPPHDKEIIRRIEQGGCSRKQPERAQAGRAKKAAADSGPGGVAIEQTRCKQGCGLKTSRPERA